jgi:hypothetical protein
MELLIIAMVEMGTIIGATFGALAGVVCLWFMRPRLGALVGAVLLGALVGAVLGFIGGITYVYSRLPVC